MEKELYFVDDNGGSWQSLYLGELNSSSERSQAPASYNTMQQAASQFEFALSSMGSMYNGSGEISPPLSCSYNNNSTTTSCYSTPLNSPPKLNLGAISLNARHGVAPLPSDPVFAERAAVNSCFGRLDLPHRCLKEMGSGNLSRVSSSKSARGGASSAAAADEEEFSSISDQIPGENAMNAKKRKAIAKNKAKEKVVKEDDYTAKRSKASGKDGEKAKNDQKQNNNNNSKLPEPPKDYIHVRARRGQATDSHSIAERVRREKISERMNVLQDLVPGCSKVTGKAVMLDEIINYVQSLQRQVEFLSMKLATVNFDSNMEAFLSKEDLQSLVSLPQTAHPFELSQAAYQFVNLQKLGFIQNALANGTDVGPQFPGIWGNDLQTVLQMGSDPNQNPAFASHNFQ